MALLVPCNDRPPPGTGDVVGLALASDPAPGRLGAEGVAGYHRVTEPRSLGVAIDDGRDGAPCQRAVATADRLPAEAGLPVRVDQAVDPRVDIRRGAADRPRGGVGGAEPRGSGHLGQ